MSALGETVLSSLVSLLPREPRGATCNVQEEEGHRAYIRHQFGTSARYFANFPDFDVTGKTVLEIGCGTGGRTAYLAAHGAKRAVGIDINAREIQFGRALTSEMYPELGDKLELLACGESERLDIGTFDVVLLVDAMEHVLSPPAMMRLAHEYTKQGGRFYFSCIGYYHQWGAHMRSTLGPLPFVNVLFSDETILNVVRSRISSPDYVPDRFDTVPPVERWSGLYDLRDRPGEHLNKLTIAAMKKLVRYSPFESGRVQVLGFGRRTRLLRGLDVLTKVPILQELYHSMVVVDCVKRIRLKAVE